MAFSKLHFVVPFLLFASIAQASVGDTIIQSGPHRGKRLRDVIANYTVPGLRGVPTQIAPRAVQDAFDFYDCNRDTKRWRNEYRMKPKPGHPGTLMFDGSRQVTVENTTTLSNQRYMVIFDLDQGSTRKRLHLIDLKTGEIRSTLAAHAKNSDCPGERSGLACRFSQNSDDGDLTPLGFFATGERYFGERGTTIALNGLEGPSGSFKGNYVASSAVIHAAEYVTSTRAGRSHGCPALSPVVMAQWANQLKDGALFYFYHSSLDAMNRHPTLHGATSPTCTPPAQSESPVLASAPAPASGTAPAAAPVRVPPSVGGTYISR